MATAQKRDAAHSKKFYFRKNVLPPGQSSPSSSTASSGTSSPCSAPQQRKEKKLRNCFPVVQYPEEGFNSVPVEEEYEEMTMDEIINGTVRAKTLNVFSSFIFLLE
jgi:glutamate--cysteine ligase catalytic subunit